MNRGDKIALGLFGAAVATVAGLSIYDKVRYRGITIDSVAIVPGQKSMPVGNTENIIAIAYYSDGSHKDVTDESVWLSDNVNVIGIEGAGMIYGVTPGNATVYVNYQGYIGASSVTVV